MNKPRAQFPQEPSRPDSLSSQDFLAEANSRADISGPSDGENEINVSPEKKSSIPSFPSDQDYGHTGVVSPSGRTLKNALGEVEAEARENIEAAKGLGPSMKLGDRIKRAQAEMALSHFARLEQKFGAKKTMLDVKYERINKKTSQISNYGGFITAGIFAGFLGAAWPITVGLLIGGPCVYYAHSKHRAGRMLEKSHKMDELLYKARTTGWKQTMFDSLQARFRAKDYDSVIKEIGGLGLFDKADLEKEAAREKLRSPNVPHSHHSTPRRKFG